MAEEGKIVASRPAASQATAALSRHLRYRRYAPWGAALLGNLLFFTLFGLAARNAIRPGSPTPDPAIDVAVISASDFERLRGEPDPAPPEQSDEQPSKQPDEQPREAAPDDSAEPPTGEAPDTPAPVPSLAPETPAPEAVASEETISEETTTEPVSPPSATMTAGNAAAIDLPETEGGGPSGLIAIRCYEIFSDPDKIAECAGRPEVRSGWTAEGADWSGIIASLKRGGVTVPKDRPWIGPPRDGLREGYEYYEPFDDGLIIGRAAAEEREDWKGYAALQDPRRGVAGMMDTSRLAGDNFGFDNTWFLGTNEPSWSLREDPHVDDRLIRELIEDRARQRRQGDE